MKIINAGVHKVFVNDFDYPKLNAYVWHTYTAQSTGMVYATRQETRKNRAGKTVFRRVLMHRQIMNAKKGEQIWHLDGNGLNNIRSNLTPHAPDPRKPSVVKIKAEKAKKYKARKIYHNKKFPGETAVQALTRRIQELGKLTLT